MASLVQAVTSEIASLIEGSLAVCRCNGKSFKVARNAQHLLASVLFSRLFSTMDHFILKASLSFKFQMKLDRLVLLRYLA